MKNNALGQPKESANNVLRDCDKEQDIGSMSSWSAATYRALIQEHQNSQAIHDNISRQTPIGLQLPSANHGKQQQADIVTA